EPGDEQSGRRRGEVLTVAQQRDQWTKGGLEQPEQPEQHRTANDHPVSPRISTTPDDTWPDDQLGMLETTKASTTSVSSFLRRYAARCRAAPVPRSRSRATPALTKSRSAPSTGRRYSTRSSTWDWTGPGSPVTGWSVAPVSPSRDARQRFARSTACGRSG